MIRNKEENCVKVKFTLNRRKWDLSPCRLLQNANIDTLARQWAYNNLPCQFSLSIHPLKETQQYSNREENKTKYNLTAHKKTHSFSKFAINHRNMYTSHVDLLPRKERIWITVKGGGRQKHRTIQANPRHDIFSFE